MANANDETPQNKKPLHKHNSIVSKVHRQTKKTNELFPFGNYTNFGMDQCIDGRCWTERWMERKKQRRRQGGETFAHHIEMHVNVIFMLKMKWNANIIFYAMMNFLNLFGELNSMGKLEWLKRQKSIG